MQEATFTCRVIMIQKRFYHSFFLFSSLLMLTILVGLLFVHSFAQAQDSQIAPSSVMTSVVPSFAQPIAALYAWDFVSDDSFQKYLSESTPFSNLLYEPVDLAPINSDFAANSPRRFKLRQEAGDQFADLAWHFWDQFKGDKLYIISAYRSKSYQDGLVRRWCRQDQCALWGTSEHQAWLAVDLRVQTKWWRIISMDTPNVYTDWLHEYAHEWWFHNTYQKWVAVDGKIVEGWHWRYLWKELAKILYDKWETIAEYYNWM